MIELPRTEDELQEEVEGMSSSRKEHLRKLACENLFFMAQGVLGHKDVNIGTHGAFCRFFEQDEYDRRMGLMPRGHLKTTIATEADSVRIAVRTKGTARILIGNEILQNAQDILKVIMKHFEENRMLRALFPELIPPKTSGPGVSWSAQGATLPRPTPYKEPTFLPIGTGGAAVSKHFTHIKCDDLIGLEASESPAEMRHAITWNDNIEGLTLGATGTIIDWIGTHWKKNDLYMHTKEMYGSRLRVFRRRIVESGPEGEYIIFPAKVNWDYIALLQKKPHIYAAQYLNDPTDELALDFNVENLRTFTFDNDGAVRFSEHGQQARWPRDLLFIVIACDPNSGSKTAQDEAAISVVGMAPDGKIFLLESYHGRPLPDEFVDKIYELACKWRPRKIGIEQAGQQNTLYYFREKCREHGRNFFIEPLKPENKDKDQRIRTALQPKIATRHLYMLVSQYAARQQVADFPNTTLKDVIDSIAYSIKLLRRPEDLETIEADQEAHQLVLATRNSLTGW